MRSRAANTIVTALNLQQTEKQQIAFDIYPDGWNTRWIYPEVRERFGLAFFLSTEDIDHGKQARALCVIGLPKESGRYGNDVGGPE